MRKERQVGKTMISAKDLSDRLGINFVSYLNMMKNCGDCYPADKKCVANVDYVTPVTQSVSTGKQLSNGVELRFSTCSDENPFCSEVMLSQDGVKKLLQFAYSYQASVVDDIFQSR